MSGTAVAFYFTLCFIIGLSSSLAVRSVVNENMRIGKGWRYNLNCIYPYEYNKPMGHIERMFHNYLVSFGRNTTGRYAIDVECSGALMTPKYIFTAAHCFYKPDGGKKDLKSLWVVGGSWRMYGYDYQRQYKRFQEAWIHTNYKPMSFINDLAIGEIGDGGFAIRTRGVDNVLSYLPYSYDQNVLSYYWKMCISIGFWTSSGVWHIDAECVRQIRPYSCNYSSGVKGAMCVGYQTNLFREQGSPLICWDGGRYSVATGILLSAVFDRHTGAHWPALYLRIKDYWGDQTVELSSAPE